MSGQDLAVALAIVASLVYLAMALLRSLRAERSGCGSACGGCSAAASANPPTTRGRISLPQIPR